MNLLEHDVVDFNAVDQISAAVYIFGIITASLLWHLEPTLTQIAEK